MNIESRIRKHAEVVDIDLNQPLSFDQSLADAKVQAFCELRPGIRVSEQPLDTMPAVLQVELADFPPQSGGVGRAQRK